MNGVDEVIAFDGRRWRIIAIDFRSPEELTFMSRARTVSHREPVLVTRRRAVLDVEEFVDPTGAISRLEGFVMACLVDDLRARTERAEAKLERVREVLDGYATLHEIVTVCGLVHRLREALGDE
jgi:hypothetical protein